MLARCLRLDRKEHAAMAAEAIESRDSVTARHRPVMISPGLVQQFLYFVFDPTLGSFAHSCALYRWQVIQHRAASEEDVLLRLVLWTLCHVPVLEPNVYCLLRFLWVVAHRHFRNRVGKVL